MFRCKAAVKHSLLESENPKYLGTDDGMINVNLMNKLYHVVAHNLNETRKARDGNRKERIPKEPEKLKIGDNVLVRDHTSKAFQPKYKDFCIIGLLGKNQVEIKDNHGHTTKVHCRDIKKIPMTEKVCQLYEEEQGGKIREGRKAVPTNKMPDLGWDIAETQLIQENQGNDKPHITFPLQALITTVVILVTSLELISAYTKKIWKFAKTTMQVAKSAIRKTSHNKFLQNIKDSYKKTMLVVTIVTSTNSRTNRNGQMYTTNRNMQNHPGTWKLNDEYDDSYQLHTSRTHNNSGN